MVRKVLYTLFLAMLFGLPGLFSQGSGQSITGGSGGISQIGDDIGLSTANAILYVNSSNQLAESDPVTTLRFDGTNLSYNETSPDAPFQINSESRFVNDDGVTQAFHNISRFARFSTGINNAGMFLQYFANGSVPTYSRIFFPGSIDGAITTYNNNEADETPSIYIEDGPASSPSYSKIGLGTKVPAFAVDNYAGDIAIRENNGLRFYGTTSGNVRVITESSGGSQSALLRNNSGTDTIAYLSDVGGGGGATQLDELSDVGTVTYTNLNVLGADGANFDAVALTAAHIQSGTFADERIASSNVTQHEALIDHDALTNFSIDEHRTINDAGTATTDLWSADKINTELGLKVDLAGSPLDNYVGIFTGPDAIEGTSALQFNGTNFGVGGPGSYNLHVQGASNNVAQFETTNSILNFNLVANAEDYTFQVGAIGISLNSGSDKYYTYKDGYRGYGTTTPVREFDVLDTMAIRGVLYDGSNSLGSAGDIATIQADGTWLWNTAPGGGNVSNTGTPVDNQIAIWTDPTTIEGVAGLTFDGTLLDVTGDATVSGIMTAGGSSTSNILKVNTDYAITSSPAERGGIHIYQGGGLKGFIGWESYTAGQRGLYLNSTQGIVLGVGGTNNVSGGVGAVNITSTGEIALGHGSPDRLFHPEVPDTVTNAVTYAQRLTHITSGLAATGFGIGTEYELENAAGTNRVAGTEEITWSDPVDATEDADYNLKLMRAGSLTTALTVSSSGLLTMPAGIVSGSTIECGSANAYRFGIRSAMLSPSDGSIQLTNNALTDFNLLQFGGTTSSEPALQKSGANLIVRLADNSANTDLEVADEAYSVSWDNSPEVPTKNALYDKIETLGGGGFVDTTVIIMVTNSSTNVNFGNGTSPPSNLMSDLDSIVVNTGVGNDTIAQNGSDELVVPYDGIYELSYTILAKPTAAGMFLETGFFTGTAVGTTLSPYMRHETQTTIPHQWHNKRLIELAANDVVGVYVDQFSGSFGDCFIHQKGQAVFTVELKEKL